MKTCYKCRRQLDLSNFAGDTARPDGLHNLCRDCKSAYNKTHHAKNKAIAKTRRAKRRQQLREYVQTYKSQRSCMDCKQQYPHYVLDFDHRDPALKVSEIASMIRDCRPLEILVQEIDKCDLVCSNCHRIRTHS